MYKKIIIIIDTKCNTQILIKSFYYFLVQVLNLKMQMGTTRFKRLTFFNSHSITKSARLNMTYCLVHLQQAFIIFL